VLGKGSTTLYTVTAGWGLPTVGSGPHLVRQLVERSVRQDFVVDLPGTSPNAAGRGTVGGHGGRIRHCARMQCVGRRTPCGRAMQLHHSRVTRISATCYMKAPASGRTFQYGTLISASHVAARIIVYVVSTLLNSFGVDLT
jgi:hypothetical protein